MPYLYWGLFKHGQTDLVEALRRCEIQVKTAYKRLMKERKGGLE